MFGVFSPTMTPNVQCLWYLTTLRYVYVVTSEHQSVTC
jgi:hypothetical protein